MSFVLMPRDSNVQIAALCRKTLTIRYRPLISIACRILTSSRSMGAGLSFVSRFSARQFICALWSPAGKVLTSWLSFVVSNCEFVTFPLVWYLIVSIPDLCTLTCFNEPIDL